MPDTKSSAKSAAESNGQVPGQVNIDGRVEMPAAAEPPVEEIRVDGTVQLGLFSAGGKKPSGSSVRFVGGKVSLLDGRAYKKGDVVSFSGVATIVEVSQRDKRDKQTRIVVEAEQRHLAEIDDLSVTPLDAA
jgi:hypothetical protein